MLKKSKIADTTPKAIAPTTTPTTPHKTPCRALCTPDASPRAIKNIIPYHRKYTTAATPKIIQINPCTLQARLSIVHALAIAGKTANTGTRYNKTFLFTRPSNEFIFKNIISLNFHSQNLFINLLIIPRLRYISKVSGLNYIHRPLPR